MDQDLRPEEPVIRRAGVQGFNCRQPGGLISRGPVKVAFTVAVQQFYELHVIFKINPERSFGRQRGYTGFCLPGFEAENLLI
ncbi:hypothetical protein D9M70_539970 [compost metagenome]